MIEVRGLVALAAALDAMSKTAASVECVFVCRVSNGYLIAGIEGELACVQEAIEVATAVVSNHGELRSAQIYPQLHPSAAVVVEELGRNAFAARLVEARKAVDKQPSPSSGPNRDDDE